MKARSFGPVSGLVQRMRNLACKAVHFGDKGGTGGVSPLVSYSISQPRHSQQEMKVAICEFPEKI